ncbi:MAG: single-stranded DNA-binding protein [Deltaproteobacteria bacterium]
MLNRVILIGRLTRDPELRYTQQGTAIARFTLAINRKFKREETDFIDIVVWQKLAENCAQYLTKGQMAMVEGRLQVRNYEGQDGQKRKAVEVVADDVKFLSKPGTGSQSSSDFHGKPRQQDEWNDLGREVGIEEVDFMDPNDEVPF